MDDINVIYGVKPTVPVFNGTAGEQIYEALLKYQDLPEAMICAQTKQVVTYRKILETTCQLAQAFQLNGFSQNSIVAVYCENCLEYLYPVLASWFIGMIVHPINHEYIKHELDYVINISKPEILFCSMKTLANARKLQKEFCYIKKVVVLDLDSKIDGVVSMHTFIRINSERFLDVYQFRPVKFDNNQHALILCSSGTTGRPKGILTTHKTLVYRFAHSMEPNFTFVDKPTSVVLSLGPRFHAIGLITSIEALLMGYCSILLKNFEPRLFLESIQEYRIKCLYLPPPLVVFLQTSTLCNQYDLSSLEDIVSGGAPLSKIFESLTIERLGKNVQIRKAYGLTETLMGVTYNPRHKGRLGSCGQVLPHLTVKVVDVKNQRSLQADNRGEIWVKGPIVSNGYINEKVDGVSRKNGWLRTGDFGYYDKDGYFYIIDRVEELITFNGDQIAPAELEAILLKHPKIFDVGVVGVPHKLYGELPTLFVCKKEGCALTQNEVMEYVSNEVSHQKQFYVRVHFVDVIPKTPSGKILRRKLREMIRNKSSKL